MENFGKNLKEYRTEKEFSQDVFATKIGIHVTNLSKYERGISIPSLEVAEKIATELNISLDQLVYGNNKAENIIKDNELLNLFVKTQDLTDGQKTTVKDLLEAFIFKTNLKKELSI